MFEVGAHSFELGMVLSTRQDGKVAGREPTMASIAAGIVSSSVATHSPRSEATRLIRKLSMRQSRNGSGAGLVPRVSGRISCIHAVSGTTKLKRWRCLDGVATVNSVHRAT